MCEQSEQVVNRDTPNICTCVLKPGSSNLIRLEPRNTGQMWAVLHIRGRQHVRDLVPRLQFLLGQEFLQAPIKHPHHRCLQPPDHCLGCLLFSWWLPGLSLDLRIRLLHTPTPTPTPTPTHTLSLSLSLLSLSLSHTHSPVATTKLHRWFADLLLAYFP